MLNNFAKIFFSKSFLIASLGLTCVFASSRWQDCSKLIKCNIAISKLWSSIWNIASLNCQTYCVVIGSLSCRSHTLFNTITIPKVGRKKYLYSSSNFSYENDVSFLMSPGIVSKKSRNTSLFSLLNLNTSVLL